MRAKWRIAGVSPRSSIVNPCETADCATCASPSASIAAAVRPAGRVAWLASNPSSARNGRAKVAINGE